MSDANDIEERILYNRKILVGKTKPTAWDKKSHNIYLEAQIKEYLKPKKDINLRVLPKHKRLSISGYSENFGGQIYDELNEENVEFKVPKENVEKIKKIWKRWHLNDLHAGTEKQEKALSKIGGVNANKYDEQVAFLKKKKLYKQKGYKYGTGWLVEDLPNEVEKEIMRLF